jgi:hypothetical protein
MASRFRPLSPAEFGLNQTGACAVVGGAARQSCGATSAYVRQRQRYIECKRSRGRSGARSGTGIPPVRSERRRFRRRAGLTDAQTFGGEKCPNVKTTGFRGSNSLIKWQRSTWGLISKTFSNNHIGRLRRSREPPKTVSIEFGYVSTRVRYITLFGIRNENT